MLPSGALRFLVGPAGVEPTTNGLKEVVRPFLISLNPRLSDTRTMPKGAMRSSKSLSKATKGLRYETTLKIVPFVFRMVVARLIW